MSRHVAQTVIANLAIQGLSALTAIILARSLGADGRGEYAAAMVWPTILAGIAVFGTEVVLARRVAAEPGNLRRIYLVIPVIAALLGVPAMLLGYALVPLVLSSDKWHLVSVSQILLWSIPASMTAVLTANVALGMREIWLFNSVRLLFGSLYFAFVLTLALSTVSSVFSVAVCFLIAAVLTAAYGMYALYPRMTTADSARVTARQIIRSGAPFGLAIAAQSIMVNLPIALLSALVDSAHVGYFVVALVASSCHSSLGSAIGKMLFARLNATQEEASLWLTAVFRQSILLYVLMSFALAVVLPYLVPLFFGDEFRISGVLAVGLLASSSLIALASLLEEALRAKGRASPILLAQLSAMAVLTSLAFGLIPTLGLKGMIAACIAAAIVQFSILGLAITKELKISVRDLVLVTRHDLRALVLRLRSVLAS